MTYHGGHEVRIPKAKNVGRSILRPKVLSSLRSLQLTSSYLPVGLKVALAFLPDRSTRRQRAGAGKSLEQLDNFRIAWHVPDDLSQLLGH